jgi:hypothetical protein
VKEWSLKQYLVIEMSWELAGWLLTARERVGAVQEKPSSSVEVLLLLLLQVAGARHGALFQRFIEDTPCPIC